MMLWLVSWCPFAILFDSTLHRAFTEIDRLIYLVTRSSCSSCSRNEVACLESLLHSCAREWRSVTYPTKKAAHLIATPSPPSPACCALPNTACLELLGADEEAPREAKEAVARRCWAAACWAGVGGYATGCQPNPRSASFVTSGIAKRAPMSHPRCLPLYCISSHSSAARRSECSLL